MERSQFAPNATQLKDVLRGMRYALLCGRDVLQKAVPTTLPPPASRIARSTLLDIDELGRNVDQVASRVAHRVLGDPKPRSYSLQTMRANRTFGGNDFSLAYYETMKNALIYLHASRMLVNQNAAQKAFDQVARDGDGDAFAARLLLQLLDEDSVRVDCTDADFLLPKNSVLKVANFAVLLYLLSNNECGDRLEMVASATDIAIAIGDKIDRAVAAKDIGSLSFLFARYTRHV